MEDLLEKLILHPKIKYSETIANPKFIFEIFDKKMIKPMHQNIPEIGFNINKVPFSNKDSIEFHKYQINVLLEIERSERDQKRQTLKIMMDNGIIDEE
jgi:hypothetical protein